MADIPGAPRHVLSTGMQSATAEVISATAADYQVFSFGWPIKITHVGFIVTTTVAADSTAPVVSFDRRITAGSDTGRVELTTLTIPDTTAAGKCVVKGSLELEVDVGEELVFEHKTQAVDGSSAAGAGHYFIVYELKNLLDTSDAAYVAGT